MLLDFTVSNFGPFDESVVLSMEASAFSDNPDSVIPAAGTKNGILASVSIFGPNASGKSYLFKAVSALKSILKKKRTKNQPIIPYYPFKVSPSGDSRPTVFKIRVLIDNVRYEYSISYTDQMIIDESLIYYPNNYPVEVFRRSLGVRNPKLME